MWEGSTRKRSIDITIVSSLLISAHVCGWWATASFPAVWQHVFLSFRCQKQRRTKHLLCKTHQNMSFSSSWQVTDARRNITNTFAFIAIFYPQFCLNMTRSCRRQQSYKAACQPGQEVKSVRNITCMYYSYNTELQFSLKTKNPNKFTDSLTTLSRTCCCIMSDTSCMQGSIFRVTTSIMRDVGLVDIEYLWNILWW